MVLLQVTILWATTVIFTKEIQSQCTCKPGHPQDEVCKSDIVIRARIDSVRNNQYDFRFDMESAPRIAVTERQYRVTIRKVFKGQINKRRPTFIFTPVGNLTCTASFDVGKVYLITGQLRGKESNPYIDQKYRGSNRINVTSCQWFTEWSKISMFMRLSVKRRYLRNCDCKISQCGTKNCPQTTSILWSPKESPKDTCLWKSGFCLNTNGNCCWKNTRRLKRCLKRNKVTLS